MGMDVKGKNGNYFRANIWTWPAIMSLVAQTEVLPQDLVNAMQFNDGAGPDERQAKQLANALEIMLAEKPDSEIIRCTGSNCPTFGLARQVLKELQSPVHPEDFSPGSEEIEGSTVEVGYLREFINFCRESGGFKVW